jgi:hypothetical protein
MLPPKEVGQALALLAERTRCMTEAFRLKGLGYAEG